MTTSHREDLGVPITDFDIESDPTFRVDPDKKWREAASVGPVFFSRSARGFFVVSSYELVREILHQPDAFSSRDHYIFYRKPMPFYDIPTQLDRPDHIPVRRLLNPLLSPSSVAEMEPFIREVTRGLIDEIIARGRPCEFNTQFALRQPAQVIMKKLGLPLERELEFVQLNVQVAHPDAHRDPDLVEHQAAVDEVDRFWEKIVAARRREPEDDWITWLIRHGEDAGVLDTQKLMGVLRTLFRGGFDTTAGTLGYAFWYLAAHPYDRERIVADNESLSLAVEEFLRVYGGVPLIGRIVVDDCDFHGARMRRGDRVVLLLRAANRDELAFSNPHECDFGRNPNKHLAFGLGPHRCVGMHLARAEVRIALEEWHERIPVYALGDMSEVAHEVSENIRLSKLPIILQD